MTKPLALALVLGAAILPRHPALGQSGEGSVGSALGGAALGAMSGSMLALTGGLGGCNRTLSPSRCSRITTATGAVLGLTAGAFIGWNDGSQLDERIENAGLGMAVGALAGLALRRTIQHYGWPDVAAASVVGMAIGASGKGAGLGLAVGAATGLALWKFHPSVGPAGAVAWALAGVGLGGMSDWVAGAVEGRSDTGAVPLHFSVRW
ncbi:MAG: hypothetical protein ACC667_02615 [Longimicrobiales bacterium]